jgi:1-acyl-sn-glycerol-3-phosphate acyltransferase
MRHANLSRGDGGVGANPTSSNPSVSEPIIDRDALVAAITKFFGDQHADDTHDDIRIVLEREIDAAGHAALECLRERLATAGADWQYFPPDPLARRIHDLLADRVLEPGSTLSGIDHVAAVAGKPVVLLANHLSYSDANLLEFLIRRAGGEELSNRLTVIAGPKVYSSLTRRFSSLCFGTIKVPQSSGLSTEDAVMNPRVAARAARRSIDAARDRLGLGDALLIFAEGTRSRTNGMQQMLVGVTRYFDWPGTWILPVGIVGTEALFPIGADTVYAVRAVARVGRPIDAGALHVRAHEDRRLIMDTIGLAIAKELPIEYRGVYDDSAPDLDDARRLLQSLRE